MGVVATEPVVGSTVDEAVRVSLPGRMYPELVTYEAQPLRSIRPAAGLESRANWETWLVSQQNAQRGTRGSPKNWITRFGVTSCTA